MILILPGNRVTTVTLSENALLPKSLIALIPIKYMDPGIRLVMATLASVVLNSSQGTNSESVMIFSMRRNRRE